MILLNIMRVVFVYALILGVLALPVYVSMSHLGVSSQAEEATRHGVLNAVETVDHCHSHDDGEDYEQQTGHSHGHDPADHSHQVEFIFNTVFADVQFGSDTELACVSDLVKLEAAFGIDRPPKLSSPV